MKYAPASLTKLIEAILANEEIWEYPYLGPLDQPSYTELKSTGFKCKCKEPIPPPIPVPVEKRKKEQRPIAINWAKVFAITLLVASIVALIALEICALATGPTIVGIPLALVCSTGAFAMGVAVLAPLAMVRNEPDTTA